MIRFSNQEINGDILESQHPKEILAEEMGIIENERLFRRERCCIVEYNLHTKYIQ